MVERVRNGTLVKFTTGEKSGQVWVIAWANSGVVELLPYDQDTQQASFGLTEQ